MRFTNYKQLDAMDCGPTCLKIIAQHYGRNYSLQNLRAKCHITREGVSLLGISDAAELIGLRATGVKITWMQLKDEMTLPCIVHWNQQHFIVVYKVDKKHVYVSDPAAGLLKYTVEKFQKSWLQSYDFSLNDLTKPPIFNPSHAGQSKGIALILEPTPEFYREKGDEDNRLKFSQLFHYLKPYKRAL